MDLEKRVSTEAPILKKQPPKLKIGNWTISIAIDNYSPGSSAAAISSVIEVDPTFLISDKLVVLPVQHPLSVASVSTYITRIKKIKYFLYRK